MIEVRKDKTSGPKRVARINRERVELWFLEHPGETVAACARALGLRWPTVKNHVVAINDQSRQQKETSQKVLISGREGYFIEKWYDENPGRTAEACALSLGLTLTKVEGYIQGEIK